MSNPRKVYPKDSVLFITTSVEEDLPFVPNYLINAILEGILAECQERYKQQLCGYSFMANHLHMIIRVTDPDMVSDFFRYFKTESAAALNRLLGRTKHTVWCEGFDSPLVLTSESVIEKLVYIYLNPVKARLVNSIDEYPGLNSWAALSKGQAVKTVRRIKYSTLTKLKKLELNFTEQMAILKRLYRLNRAKFKIKVTPYSWMENFHDMDCFSPDNIKDEIIRRVRAEEEKIKKENIRNKKSVIGVRRLIRQVINGKYESKRSGKRTRVISSNVTLRINGIKWHKKLSKDAQEAWLLLKFGLKAELPPGFYGPGKVVSSNIFNFMALDFRI
ncbi:MAG: transposase [Deltaproteobacteria bacterium]|nr:transposase [Deltaproteobacteria bacterium]